MSMDEARKRIIDAFGGLRSLGLMGVLALLRDKPRYWYRIFRHSIRLFLDNRGPYQANALAYRSMISLVPMLAFMISLLTWLMGDRLQNLTVKLQEIMKDYVVPESELVARTFELIDKFKDAARGGTGFGFLILLLTSILLINGIEVIFNNIWHVTRRRPYAWRVLSYTAMTLLIPAMLGVSIYMTAQIQVESVDEALRQNLVIRHLPLFQWTLVMVRDLAIPLAIVWALFLAMYKWLPNTTVETVPALVGALVAAVAFEVCKWGFSIFAAKMVESRQLWWGPIGVFLVFLVWVYLIWWVVLFGAQLAYVIQNYRYVFSKGHELEGRMGEAYLGARVMLEIAKRHSKGEQSLTVSDLAQTLEVEVPRIQRVLSRLTDAGHILLGTVSGRRGKYREVYVPARDLASITVSQVVNAVTDVWKVPAPEGEMIEPDDDEGTFSEPAPPGTAEHRLGAILDDNMVKMKGGLSISFRQIIERNAESGRTPPKPPPPPKPAPTPPKPAPTTPKPAPTITKPAPPSSGKKSDD